MAYHSNARQKDTNEERGRSGNRRKKVPRRDPKGLGDIREVLETEFETTSNVVALPKQKSKESEIPILKVHCIVCKGEMNGNLPFGFVLDGFVCQAKCSKAYFELRAEEMMTHPATKVTSF